MKFICSCCRYPFEHKSAKKHDVHANAGQKVFNETLAKFETDHFLRDADHAPSNNVLCPDCYNGVFPLKGNIRQS